MNAALLVACVLVAALPGVFAYAAPVTLWVVRARARAAGVFLDDRRALAVGPRVDTVLLDRWGTVTTGQLRVVAIDPVEPDHERNLRWFAGALGHASDDPVGRAIARLSSRGKLSQVQRHHGGGISGSVDRHPVRLGSPEWLGMQPRNGVGVTVGVQVDARPIGYITVADDVRPHAAEGVERLRADQVEPVLVSDDTEGNTRQLADTCGIEHWYAATPADQREQLVDEHRRRGRVVAVASPTPVPHADLTLSDAASTQGIRLVDLDVGRVATALALTRSAARATVRSRRTGIVLGLAGVGLAAASVLSLPLAIGYAVVACGIVAVVASLATPSTPPRPVTRSDRAPSAT
ncbi:cation-translocating P-type ATPase [Pimelobacter simplex]|uniref:Cation-translocating P-type ATPase n=1 Tax=Nocardioides simplex TaxID=2045 RepID=A0A7J5DR00_NOCSI|nr:HAD family hydrolase [Pimelobacter simplex]KAB2807176.1 cation-translocating P-type ATPase [Pimelobacter simplex]